MDPVIFHTIVFFGEKSKTHNLQEYEMLVYEQLCRMVETMARIQETAGKLHIIDLENQLKRKANDEDTNPESGDSVQRDEGPDAPGGCTVVTT